MSARGLDVHRARVRTLALACEVIAHGTVVLDAARELIGKHGDEILPKVAKMHFKTSQEV